MRSERGPKIRATSASLVLKRNRAAVIALFAVLLTVAASTGCAVKFIGDYDAAIDNGVSDIQQRAEVYIGKLKADPTTPYDPAFYTDISARVKALKTRADVLPQYTIIDQQLTELQGQFDRMQALDKDMKRPIIIGIFEAIDNAITVNVESILKLELALKRGDKEAPTAKQ